MIRMDMYETEEHIYLSIGSYRIYIQNKSYAQGYRLPENAYDFLERERSCLTKVNFIFIIQLDEELEGELKQSDHISLKEFNFGPNQYQIDQLSDHDLQWIRKDTKGNTKISFRIQQEWNQWKLICDHSHRLGKESFTELGYIFAYSVLNYGGVMFHGVVLEWEGKGIIFCAHSGVGKTTHTRMWKEQENALILNGDRALCYKEGNQWYTCGAPWCGSSEDCVQKSIELRAFVILEQAQENIASVLSPLQGALELIPLVFAPTWDKKLMSFALDTIDDMVQKIPCFKLRCKPEPEAVRMLKFEIERFI